MTEKALHHCFKLSKPSLFLMAAIQNSHFEQLYNKNAIEVFIIGYVLISFVEYGK